MTTYAPPAAPAGAASQRLLWVDTLKGIGILAVVAAHIYTPPVSTALYLFHMPLFFVLGGYLFRPRPVSWAFAREKALHLLLPYACFLALFYPLQVYLAFHTDPPRSAHALLMLVAAPLVGGKLLVGPTAVFWFVTCFFLTQQLVNALIARFRPRALAVLMAVLLALAYANSILFPRLWLPWNANVVLAAAPLFYAGYWMRQHGRRMPLWAALALAALSLVLIASGHLDVPDMKSAHLGTPLLALLFSLAWVAVLAALARRLTPLPAVSPALQSLGAASMVVMYAHQPIQMTLEHILGLADPTLRFAAAVLGSWLLFLLFNRGRATRLLFLGIRATPASASRI